MWCHIYNACLKLSTYIFSNKSCFIQHHNIVFHSLATAWRLIKHVLFFRSTATVRVAFFRLRKTCLLRNGMYIRSVYYTVLVNISEVRICVKYTLYIKPWPFFIFLTMWYKRLRNKQLAKNVAPKKYTRRRKLVYMPFLRHNWQLLNVSPVD